MSHLYRDLYDRMVTLRSCLTSLATNDHYDGPAYEELREELFENAILKDGMPDFIRTCHTGPEFWQFIKYEFGTYAERREYLRKEFASLLTRLEELKRSPVSQTSDLVLRAVNSAHVSECWAKCSDRVKTDPDGALTAARALVETVCRHVLAEYGESAPNDVELAKLYKMAASKLNLAPEQHTEPVLRQVTQGCVTVVEGLAAMRNRLGDAHGKDKKALKPLPRHAALGVNVAGAVCALLVETLEARSKP